MTPYTAALIQQLGIRKQAGFISGLQNFARASANFAGNTYRRIDRQIQAMNRLQRMRRFTAAKHARVRIPLYSADNPIIAQRTRQLQDYIKNCHAQQQKFIHKERRKIFDKRNVLPREVRRQRYTKNIGDMRRFTAENNAENQRPLRNLVRDSDPNKPVFSRKMRAQGDIPDGLKFSV